MNGIRSYINSIDCQWKSRMKLSVFAVFLMWASSLKVAFYVTSLFVHVPDPTQVLRSIQNTIHIVQHEKATFNTCVMAQLERCDKILNTTSDAEIKRVNQTTENNSHIIDDSQHVQSQCFASYSNIYRSMQKYVQAGGSISYSPETTCNASDRESLSVMVGDLGVVRSQAYELSSSYGEDSINTVNQLAEYAQERGAYDRDYVQNHTRFMQEEMELYMASIEVPQIDMEPSFVQLSKNIENLVSCISLRHSDGGKCQYTDISIRQYLDAVIQQLQNQQSVLLEQWDQFNTNALQYKANALTAYQQAMAFHDGEQFIYY